MHTIEIDFQVFKELTVRREAETVTYNDVIRELLKLPPNATSAQSNLEIPVLAERPGKHDFVTKGVRFPSGTLFRATYKGRLHTAKVQLGKLWLDGGKSYESLSSAAVAITGSAVNGWRFWECKRPGDQNWSAAESLRAA